MKTGQSMILIGAAVVSCLLIAQVAAAGTVSLKNCIGSPVWVKAFDSTDGFMLVASKEGCVQPSGSITLTCATSTCKVGANIRKCETFQPRIYGTFSGPVVIWAPAVGGKVSKGSSCPS